MKKICRSIVAVVVLFCALLLIKIVYLNHTQRRQAGAIPVAVAKSLQVNQGSRSLVALQTNVMHASLPIRVLSATNISQWKLAFAELRKTVGLPNNWTMDQSNRYVGIPVVLSENGMSLDFGINFMNVETSENGFVKILKLYGPFMNIEETKILGLSICRVLGRDPEDFVSWCNEAGNRWLDVPLFYTRGLKATNSDELVAFTILNSFNNDKPWIVGISVIYHQA